MATQEKLREQLEDLQELASSTGHVIVHVATIEHWLTLLAASPAEGERRISAMRGALERISELAPLTGNIVAATNIARAALLAYDMGEPAASPVSPLSEEQDDYDAPARRRARDLVTVVMSVVSGAPADNLPDDCAAIVKHWLEGLNVSIKPRGTSEAGKGEERG